MPKRSFIILLIITQFLFIGCSSTPKPSIINRHAEALLTKNNELQFRFKINEEVFTNEKMYQVKVQIHDDRLASALGNKEIVYGSEEVYNGQWLDVKDDKKFIYMEPIPLLLDLHIDELQMMIMNQHAVSVQIMSDEKVIAQAFLTNFTSQM
jgi:uncharacterized protein YcfL